MKLGTQVGLGPGHIVLDGDPAPSPKGVGAPQFSAHVYCDQTSVCVRIPLGTEVHLGPGYIVLDRDPATPRERSTAAPLSPVFGPCLLWPRSSISATVEF